MDFAIGKSMERDKAKEKLKNLYLILQNKKDVPIKIGTSFLSKNYRK
jgi:hypothetical protein